MRQAVANTALLGLPRTRKMTKADAFASALRMRVCARTEDFILHYKADARVQEDATEVEIGARLGLLVPKRFAKRAVARNTLKRLARESFRQRAHALPAGDWLMRLHRPVHGLPLSSAQKKHWAMQLNQLFEQAQPLAEQWQRRQASSSPSNTQTTKPLRHE